MKIITFSKRVSLATAYGPTKTECNVNPGERLIFDDDNAASIQQNPGSAAYIYEITDLGPLLKELPAVRDWKRRRILFYRNRGIGDQLICAALSRYAREILGAECYQVCDRVHEPVWAYNAYIGGMPMSVPIHLDSVWRSKGRPFFDKAFFIESASEWDNDGEQPNVYDRMFDMIGIESARVPARYKRPVFSLQPEDVAKRVDWLRLVSEKTGRDLTRGYMFVQLRTTNAVRSIPLGTIEKVLVAVNEFAERKGLTIVCADDRPFPPEVAELIDATPAAINVAGAIVGVRMLGSIIAGAMLVIGPDSSALHFAAAFEVPAIGFWGPFSPESRTAYYPNQIHIFHSELCPNAPCYNFLPDLPIHKCPRGSQQKHCEVFDGASMEEISEAIKMLL